MPSLSELTCVSVIFATLLDVVTSSVGDRSLVYRRCHSDCVYINCLGDGEKEFMKHQPYYLQLLQWTCKEECQYDCMWQAVDAYQRDGSKIPQFGGKWPFIRVLGVQEPVSVIASALNFLSVANGLRIFIKTVPWFSPMYFVWVSYALICMNAWFWSIVYHSRDLRFTELMDYFTALSLVMSCFVCFCFRIVRTRPLWKSFALPLPFILFFTNHCAYLAYVKFDYKYNMTVNIIFALASSFAWITWCAIRWKSRPYMKRCILAMVILNISAIFEVLDFPAILWTVDAHSLWHIGTIPVGTLFFTFAAEDCLYITETLRKKNKIT